MAPPQRNVKLRFAAAIRDAIMDKRTPMVMTQDEAAKLAAHIVVCLTRTRYRLEPRP